LAKKHGADVKPGECSGKGIYVNTPFVGITLEKYVTDDEFQFGPVTSLFEDVMKKFIPSKDDETINF
tara:strand:+ start:301 stop:501 length:201 start_codon:yes stop_codon:yes gene_type:complete